MMTRAENEETATRVEKRKQQAKWEKSSPSTNGKNDGSEEEKLAIEDQKRTLVDTKKKSK